MSSPSAQLCDGTEHLASGRPFTLPGPELEGRAHSLLRWPQRGQLLAPGPRDKSTVPLAENPVWAAWREAMAVPLAACFGPGCGWEWGWGLGLGAGEGLLLSFQGWNSEHLTPSSGLLLHQHF